MIFNTRSCSQRWESPVSSTRVMGGGMKPAGAAGAPGVGCPSGRLTEGCWLGGRGGSLVIQSSPILLGWRQGWQIPPLGAVCPSLIIAYALILAVYEAVCLLILRATFMPGWVFAGKKSFPRPLPTLSGTRKGPEWFQAPAAGVGRQAIDDR